MSAVMRVMKLEKLLPLPSKQRDALLLVTGEGRDPERLNGVIGVNVSRESNESLQAFLDRLEAHVRRTRGRAIPLVALAQYADDDPDE